MWPIPHLRCVGAGQYKTANVWIAIEKPPHISSAQVIRDLQTHFAKSQTFKPLLEETQRTEQENKRGWGSIRRFKTDNKFKIGHGGTLDPLATGVLIIGIGRNGTKHLQSFLGCTKTYDTVVLFGKDTDTYDVAGRVVATAACEHLTKAMVEGKLAKFRGEIKQVPPIYSALKINGMKAYEYARSGKELPRELESRDMTVGSCEMMEWYGKGSHGFRYPADEASGEEKEAAAKFRNMEAQSSSKNGEECGQQTTSSPAAPADAAAGASAPADSAKTPNISSSNLPLIPKPITELADDAPPKPKPSPAKDNNFKSQNASAHTHDASANLEAAPAEAPAALIRLSVSSGFYVRSFAHDLGLACNSLAMMATLVRTRQGDFVLPHAGTSNPATARVESQQDDTSERTQNEEDAIDQTGGSTEIAAEQEQEPAEKFEAISYADLEAGEDVWGPKIRSVLDRWNAKLPSTVEKEPQNIGSGDRKSWYRDRNSHGRGSFRGQGYNRKRKSANVED